MKVLFTYNYGEEAMTLVKSLGLDAEFFDEKLMADYQTPEEVEVLICYNPFKMIDLKKYTNLKVILLSSIGFDQLPLALVKEMNITVCNNRGGYSIPMGEWIVMKVLEMVKHSRALYDNQNMQLWKMDTTITELYNKTILFFGTGTIAKEAAKRLQGFGMKIVGLNTSGHEEQYFDVCYALKDSLAIIPKASAIVIALPLTHKTKGLFGKTQLDMMNKDAVLVNIARGEILDEKYLVEVLRENRIKAAALDVFYQEPLPKEHPLWSLDNVVITCHNSWISEMRNQRRFDTIYKNLKLLKSGETLVNIINLERGY